MSEERATNLAILSIEYEYAKINLDEVIDKFAEVKLQKVKLCYS